MEQFLPAGLDITVSLLLVLTAGATSMLTAAMGIGGGLMLLAVMALLVPAGVLIPAHGLVQCGSNINRTLMTRSHIDWSLVKYFALGALLGAGSASLVVIQLPVQIIQICVAVFIFYLLWGPKPAVHEPKPAGQFGIGAFTSFLTMFVGATGPLVGAYVHRHDYDKLTTTATFAACMSLQHLLKIIIFTLAGYTLWDWLPLLAAMIISGFVGTWLGLKILHRTPGERFKTGFRWLVSLLALRLLWQAFTT